MTIVTTLEEANEMLNNLDVLGFEHFLGDSRDVIIGDIKETLSDESVDVYLTVDSKKNTFKFVVKPIKK